jgi:class 3 adenylate cyclase/tetratricopeptide (TPR) repeat protein
MAGKSCPSCSTENPAQARFCLACGTALALACASCGESLPGEARFCMSCGTPVAAPGGTPAPPGQPAAVALPTPYPTPESPPEERRQVTVLFADLSGYTAVSENLDPEQVKRLVDRSLSRLQEEVDRYGGRVDKFMGDNVMALFGAPVAHEDDPQRAVRAGLGMQAAMAEINERIESDHGVSLALRVGINSGEVLAGAVGTSYTVTGDVVNVASRLQTAAEPGTVVVGERTYRATSDSVEFRPLPPLALKGKAEPVPAWQAIGVAAQAAGRRAARVESPLVGRDDELALLLEQQGRTLRERRAHLMTVVGQAGVGKSRLLREFESALGMTDPAPAFRQGRCPPYGAGVVYWAFGEILRQECGIVEGDPSEVAWEKLSQRLDGAMKETGEAEEGRARKLALVGRVLGIEPPEGAREVADDDPQRAREAFFSAVRSCVEGMALERPLVLAFEDIHWADGGMLDLIEHVARFVRAPVLVLCMTRHELLERRPDWVSGRRTETLTFLEPLSGDQARALVEALLPAEDAELASELARRTGGNPLFVEEMVRRVQEEGGADVTELPETVQAVLAARLDSLAPFERRILQHAAVVGQRFWQDSLSDVALAEGCDLQETIATLEEKDILVPDAGSRRAGDPELAFKHVLIRDVAYGMLPKAVRARKHLEVGAFLEQRAGDRADEVVTLLAEHYARAATLGRESSLPAVELERIDSKALRFLEAAGDAASGVYSNQEAFTHYQSALDGSLEGEIRARIAEKQGDSALRLGRVDAALALWRECLEYHRGEEDLERVAALCRKIGAALVHKGERQAAIEHLQRGINLLKDGPPNRELVRLYEEAALLYINTGDNMLAIYAAEKALRLAERLGETRAASRAHGIFGSVFGRIGDTSKARENLERSVELARGSDKEETIRALIALGQQLEVSQADYAGAQDAYGEALELAGQVGDVPAQIEIYAGLAQLAVYKADWPEVSRFTAASRDLAEREGLVGRLSLPLTLEALLHWREGDWDEAENLYERAHELAAQAGWSEIAFSALYGRALVLRDRRDYSEAVSVLGEALDVCERAGLVGRSIQAMSQRGVVLHLDSRSDQARESAQEALALAERLNDPVGRAAALEADGVTADGADAAVRLREAADAWTALGRPLEAARCELLLGRALGEHKPQEALAAVDAAAAAFEKLGVPHLADRARSVL